MESAGQKKPKPRAEEDEGDAGDTVLLGPAELAAFRQGLEQGQGGAAKPEEPGAKGAPAKAERVALEAAAGAGDRTIALKDVAFLVSLAPVPGRVVILAGEERTIIGRERELFRRKLVLDDPGVSRRHCTIERTPGGFVLTDSGSSNHTFVNGNPVSSYLLTHGDEIEIPPRFTFVFVSQIDRRS
jgi:hypothetical protein